MRVYSTMKATYYADKFQGRKMANGKTFDNNKSTAAIGKYYNYFTVGGYSERPNDCLKVNDYIKVTNLETRKSIVVQITDTKSKGEWGLDLSQAAYKRLGLSRAKGWGWVRVEETTWEV